MKISNTSKSISNQFLQLDLFDFFAAAEYVKNLPYKRNSDKTKITCVLDDFGGTCSTKHAFLKQFADEKRIENVKLMLGIFMMNAKNTKKFLQFLKIINLKKFRKLIII